MRQARIAIGLLLAALMLLAGGPGFRSRRQFEEHFAKHFWRVDVELAAGKLENDCGRFGHNALEVRANAQQLVPIQPETGTLH